MPRRAALALTALALSVAPLAAIDDTDNPSQPRGLGGPSGVVNATPFGTDAVSTSNGAVSISIPIGQRYASGGAMGHQLTLFYSSSVWTYSLGEIFNIACASGEPLCTTNTSVVGAAAVNPDFNAGVGWQLALGRLEFPDPPEKPAYVYVDSAGGRHKFFDDLRKDAPSDNNSNHFYTRDGSYLRLRKAHSGVPNRIEFPDGTMHEFDSSGRVVLMKDRFGNQTTVTYTGNEYWTISDGIRTQTVRFINYGSQYGGTALDPNSEPSPQPTPPSVPQPTDAFSNCGYRLGMSVVAVAGVVGSSALTGMSCFAAIESFGAAGPACWMSAGLAVASWWGMIDTSVGAAQACF